MSDARWINTRETTVRAMTAPWRQAVELLIMDRSDGTSRVGRCIVVAEEMQPGVDYEPSLRISETAAQQLMDDLWACGLRPTEGTGSAGAMAATQKHVDDLRKIVFKTLDIQG